ncbi:MAG: hypothetical protein QOJ42_8125, partial [Acidobacteriaceae bacterium]|nr:hypothetical protein [Acidobacteriaceae bacterium]
SGEENQFSEFHPVETNAGITFPQTRLPSLVRTFSHPLGGRRGGVPSEHGGHGGNWSNVWFLTLHFLFLHAKTYAGWMDILPSIARRGFHEHLLEVTTTFVDFDYATRCYLNPSSACSILENPWYPNRSFAMQPSGILLIQMVQPYSRRSCARDLGCDLAATLEV